MSFSENDTFSFWENDAVFGNRYSFGNCPRLQNLGHMAGPSIGNGANHLGLPSDGEIVGHGALKACICTVFMK